jgi:hypothetical protein
MKNENLKAIIELVLALVLVYLTGQLLRIIFI